MIDSDLLKQSIADARAVRATALANAASALQEAFAPKFQAMFAQKLAEEAEEQDEVSAPHNVSATSNVPKTKDVSQGNPKKVANRTPFKAVKAGEGPKDVPPGPDSILDEEHEEEQEEVYDQQDEAGLTSEDLDEIIRELEAEVSNSEEEHVAKDDVSSDVPPADPVATEPAPAPTDGVNAPPTDDVAPPVDDSNVTPPAEVPSDSERQAPVSDVPPAEPDPTAEPKDETIGPSAEEDEEIDLNELLKSLNEDSEEEGKKEEEDEAKLDEAKKEDGYPDKKDKHYSNISKDPTKAPRPNKEEWGKKTKALSEASSNKEEEEQEQEEESVKKENVSLKEQLGKFRETVEFLRQQINEINLLNAKLLYTNKLFKEFSLNNDQKMRVVEAFDLTKNVREVKLTYAVIAESYGNFGGKSTVDKKKTTVAAVGNKTVATITEGLASKTVGSTKPNKEIISESVASQMAQRFQKLAGIVKQPTEQPKTK